MRHIHSFGKSTGTNRLERFGRPCSACARQTVGDSGRLGRGNSPRNETPACPPSVCECFVRQTDYKQFRKCTSLAAPFQIRPLDSAGWRRHTHATAHYPPGAGAIVVVRLNRLIFLCRFFFVVVVCWEGRIL